MIRVLLASTLFFTGFAFAQTVPAGEEKWGIVLEHPDMRNVSITRDVIYFQDQSRALKLDIYIPPQAVSQSLGCVIFLTEMNKDRSWQIYQSWPRLMAAHGLIGIAIDVNKETYLSSIKKVLEFIRNHGTQHRIDTSKVGVYIPSHVPADVTNFLIREKVNPSVKATAMFCSDPSLKGPFRDDLPVFYVADDQLTYPADHFSSLWSEVQKSKAPWTLRFGSGMPIFFESFADTDEARKIIREAIYFFKNHLEPLPASDTNYANDREMIATLYRADYTQAGIEFKQWLDKYPDDQYALNKYAMLSFIQKNYIEAEQTYKKVKDLHPVYRIDLVKALLANNKEAEATRELTLAMRSGKVKRSPYPAIAAFLYSIDRFSQGIEYYEMASEQDLRGEDFYNMARGYAKINDVDKALMALEKSIALKFPSPQQIESESDFAVLRSDQRFRQLMSRNP